MLQSFDEHILYVAFFLFYIHVKEFPAEYFTCIVMKTESISCMACIEISFTDIRGSTVEFIRFSGFWGDAK